MYKSMRLLFLALITIASLVFGPVTPVYAASLPAEINKQFTPDFIDAGGVSRLRITIFNPNTFPLSNATWSDNLVGVQPGLSIANPPNVTHNCGLGAVVTAAAGSTTISLANGAVSAQVGVNPGECYVEVDVTATLPGARINTIPAGNLTSQGIDGVTPVTVSNTTPASATLTVVAVAPPSLSKSFAPNTIYIGEVSQLTIRINNNDVDTNLTNVRYTDTLPVGLVLATPVSPVVLNCGTYTLVATAGTNTIALSGATVTPGQDCLVTVNVTGTAGIYTNTIPAGPLGPGSLTTQQGVTNGSPASADLNVQPVSIQKIFAPGTITAGGTSVLTITLQNPSSTPYTNVSLTDNLPTGLTVSGVPTTTCGGSLTNNATSITLTGGTIPASATPPTLSTCTITVTVLANLSISGTRTNTIPANSLTTSVPGVTNLFPASGNLNVNAALTGTKTYSPTTMVLGGSSTVTIVLSNNSATPLTGVNFTDTMPANLTVFGTPATPQCNGGTITNSINSVTLTGGSIPANSTCTIAFSVTSAVPGSGTTYENTIPANAISTTEGPKNTSIIRTGTDLTVVNAYTLPVGVSKNFQTNPISPGSTSRLRITITAPIDTALSGLTVIDNLVSGLVIAASPAPTESCPGGTLTAVAGTNFIRFTNLTANVLAANASCNIDVWVTSTVPGTYSNVIPATTITSDQGRTNLTDSNTATLTVTGMTMSKAFYPTIVQAGGHSTLVITLVNTSDAPLINLQVTDDLPGTVTNGLTVAPIPNASTTCGPGTVTANNGTQAITLTGGVIPAQVGGVPGTCTITVDVQGNDSTPLTGTSFTNSIPVTNVSALVQSVGVTIRPQSQAQADLGIQPLTFNITKSIDPVFVYGGAHSTLSISLLNPNNTDLTGITFTDNMPLNMKIFDPPAFDIGTCGGVITGTPGDTSFSFSGGVLAANSNCTLSLRVVMNIEGTITNQIDAGDVTTNNGVSNPQPVAASLTNLPGVSVKKSFNPSAIMAGNPSTLTITITNTTNINVVDMGLTDNLPTALPTGLVVATPANASTTCSGATLTASPNDIAVVLSGGNLNGFQSCVIQVDVTSAIPGIFINTIGVGQLAALTEGSGLPVNNNDPASDTLTVTSSTFSLGNRVWYDTDNSGTINGTEAGINGVTVQLYAADISGNPTGGVLGTKVTANGGYYRFDDLATGDYVVVIPSAQLQTGGPLAGYWSSGTTLGALGVVGETAAPDPDNNTDVDDNGTLQPGGDVLSEAITLGPTANEPTNDADANPTNPAGESANNQSNRTVDFGFYRMQLGDQIFIDVNGNGTFDGGDAAMSGALVQLYAGDGTELLTGADGIRGTADDGYGPDGVSGNGDDSTGGVLTGAGGTYLFSALPAGDYYVGVTPSGGGYLSTIDTFSVPDSTDPDANINNNDNGVGTSAGQVFSATVTLTPGGFGAALSNSVSNVIGTTSNPTLDFGFVLPGFSLGNRVWFDTDNSSTINGAEVGVDDVTVQLFAADVNGNPSGSAIGTQVTVNGGYYRFDNLNPGTYVVVLPASNFTLTGKLYKYWSSGTTVLANSAISETAAPDPDNNTDSDDNGTRQIGGAFNYAVLSKPVTLEAVASEPTNDTDVDPTNPAGEAVNDQSNRTVDFGFYRTDIGDQIFLDVNQNGTFDVGTDAPLSGAVVRLYTNNNIEVNVGLDGILGTSDDIPGGVLTTASGTYLFSGLPQGNYIVKVTPPSGFSSTIDTFDAVDSADPDTNTNNNDNGIGNGMGQVASGTLTMTPGETGVNITTANASGTTSDPSVDFGFVPGYSLGNRVWFDTNNDRSLDLLLEVGVDDVLVQLYAADGSGNPVGAVLGSTFTLGGGYYRFDNLPAGDYVVVIPADNFIDNGLNDILVGYLSSGTTIVSSGGLSEVVAPDPDNNVDLDDNGARQLSGNVISRAVTLGPGIVEPLLETDPVTNPSLGEAPDGQSNRTVDFGFYRQQLGDQIFSDLDGDGMFTVADAPLAGATVKLYASDGVTEINVGLDGVLGTTDDAAGGVTTVANGTYLFGGLPEGSYIVKVTPLTGYSAIDNGNVPAEDDSLNPNLNLDNNDNGHGVSTGQVTSSVFSLTPGVAGVSTTVDNSTATTINPSLDFGFTPLYSLGNRIWFDTNNDSTIGAGEVGVDNVRVELYQDNGNGTYDAGDTFLSFDVTNSTGYYRFDGLPAGNYVVLIPGSQLGVGGPLNLYWSSGTNIAGDGSIIDSTAVDPDNDVDNDDNGITSLTSNAIDYVSSQAVTLGPGLGESINDNDPVTNPDLGEAPNNQSNRTVDFGFYRLELSNQIFWDINSDGLFLAGDVVIPDAVVKLYSGDGSAEINVGPDGILGTVDDATGGVISSSVDGTYLFGGLPEGNYIVRVTPPVGFSSTVDTGNAGDTATPNNNYDNNDNGVGVANGEVSSNAVPLTPGIVNLSNVVTNGTGTTLNPTLDFGFIPDAMFRFSLGNRVWFDTNNDGMMNGAEIGSANVRVDLFVDNGVTAGVYDAGDTFVDFKTTDSNGYYRFDDLAAGNYVVVILSTQFAAGGPLDGYWNSGTSIAGNGVATDGIGPDVDTNPADSDDNGVTTFAANIVNYVSSRAVTLGPTANEPVGETDKLPNPDAGEEPDSQSNRTVDFGFYQVQLSDLIFVDVNNNGLYNSGDLPLAGARVQLFASNGTTEINVGPDGILGTADDAANGMVTLANGLYLFSGLPAGDYIVKVTPPAGYLSTVDINADTTTPNNNLNNNDNGIGVGAGQVSSNPVSLIAGVSGASTTVTNSIAITHNPSMDFGFNVTNGFLKTVAGTSEPSTGGTDVTIGEIVTYRITMDLVAGVALNNVVITDSMEKGLAFVDCSSINIAGTPGLCSPVVSSITDPGDSAGNPANAGRQVIFTIGNIPAPATDSTLVLEYRVIVLDVIENQNGDGLNNSATVTWTGGSLSSNAPSVKVVEPDMVIEKSANLTNGVPLGTPIEFTLTINHTSPQSTADAFDIEVTDILPPGLEYVPCSVTYSGWIPTSPVAPAYCPGITNTLTFTWNSFPRGQVAVINFTARLVGTPATNSASVAWTSLDIDPGVGGLPQQRSLHNTKSTERWYDPSDAVNIYAVTDILTINESAASTGEGESSNNVKLPVVLPATGFAPNVVTILPEQSADKSYSATDVWMEMPSLGIKMPIVGVPLVNEDWNLTWLSQEAGWLEGTAFPGWEGNSALTGHVTLPNGTPGPFANLNTLNWGDRIIVHAYGEAYIYEVRENRTIKPYSTSILQHEEDAWLTLITCKTYVESTNTYADRTAVRAVLVKVQSDTSVTSAVNMR